MASFESKFCKWSGWDEASHSCLQFYVTEWTDYAKNIIKSKGLTPENFDIFLFDCERGFVEFVTKDGKGSFTLKVELCVVEE